MTDIEVVRSNDYVLAPGTIYFETGVKESKCEIVHNIFWVTKKPSRWNRMWQFLLLGWRWTPL